MDQTQSYGSKLENVKGMVNKSGRQFQSQFRDVDERLRELVSERPLVAVAGAVGIGYIIGKLFNFARR